MKRMFYGEDIMNIKQSIIDFVTFENETSIIYPWKIEAYKILTMYIDAIVKECNGDDDTDTIYFAISKICGEVV